MRNKRGSGSPPSSQGPSKGLVCASGDRQEGVCIPARLNNGIVLLLRSSLHQERWHTINSLLPSLYTLHSPLPARFCARPLLVELRGPQRSLLAIHLVFFLFPAIESRRDCEFWPFFAALGSDWLLSMAFRVPACLRLLAVACG